DLLRRTVLYRRALSKAELVVGVAPPTPEAPRQAQAAGVPLPGVDLGPIAGHADAQRRERRVARIGVVLTEHAFGVLAPAVQATVRQHGAREVGFCSDV